MNLSAENIGKIRELVRSGYPLKTRDAKDLQGHNDHLIELLEARGRLMLGVEIERDQLKADNERLRADYAGLARFNPEWDRVAAAQDSVREHMAMVVQLKAEIAGLKTGYEAYERVNAELKAECDQLRVTAQDALAGQMAATNERDLLRAENELLGSSRAKLMGKLSRLRAKHKDWSVDAAMGQGGQS